MTVTPSTSWWPVLRLIKTNTSRGHRWWKTAHRASSAVKSPICVRLMTGSIKSETRYSADWSKGVFAGEAGVDVCESGTSTDTEGETGVDVCESGARAEADSSSSMRCRSAAFSCWTTTVLCLERSKADRIFAQRSCLSSRSNSFRTRSRNEEEDTEEIPSPAASVLGLPSGKGEPSGSEDSDAKCKGDLGHQCGHQCGSHPFSQSNSRRNSIQCRRNKNEMKGSVNEQRTNFQIEMKKIRDDTIKNPRRKSRDPK